MGQFIDLSGRQFGHYTVLFRAENYRGKTAQWTCRCDCGNVRVVQSRNLISGNSTGCGCQRGTHGQASSPEYRTWIAMRSRCFNKTHQSYPEYGGRGITVCDRWLGESGFENFLADLGPKPTGKHSLSRVDKALGYSPDNCRWLTFEEAYHLKRKTDKPMPIKHGFARRIKSHPIYRVWTCMKQRCTNPKYIGWKNYGGRGITVCERWSNSFENFLADMGERPTETHTIERINNDGNYEPSNCRWATRKEQAQNRRHVVQTLVNRRRNSNGRLLPKVSHGDP